MILEKDHKGKRILNPLLSKIRLRVIYQCENFQREWFRIIVEMCKTGVCALDIQNFFRA
jgi:hypothetical protein